MRLMQTGALFLDAYRELNARKLFWIALAISGLVVAAFAAIGINERNLTFLWWDLPIPGLTSAIMPPDVLYKTMFTQLGIQFWLAWIATILALVSTASIFPDFIASGSIELALARPMSRVRLFLTKFATGLIFVTLQVAVFTAASFLVIGLRGGVWEPGLFWAVPLVVLFFSYLFSVCALLGLLTRSAIASLLLTLLVWFSFFIANVTDGLVLSLRESSAVAAERAEESLRRLESRGADEERLEDARRKLAGERAGASRWRMFHRGVYTVKTVMPKTDETISLLERTLISSADLDRLQTGMSPEPERRQQSGFGDPEVIQRVQQEVRDRPVWWIIGTSLAFEGAVLAIAGWIFVRRDF